MNKITYYKVGGTVRDELLGLTPSDLDLVAIGGNFEELCADIERSGGKIFLKQEPFLTVRCLFPNVGPCDIRLARKDGAYGDGRRPDEVFIADSLEEDSLTRDCTINAMYRNLQTGEIIDFHNGQYHLSHGIICAVGKPEDRIREDSIRLLRFLRFSITKNFRLDRDLWRCYLYSENTSLLRNVSAERIREEIYKCFKHDMHKTLKILTSEDYKYLYEEIFNERTGIWLKPTMEAK